MTCEHHCSGGVAGALRDGICQLAYWMVWPMTGLDNRFGDVARAAECIPWRVSKTYWLVLPLNLNRAFWSRTAVSRTVEEIRHGLDLRAPQL
jgi:hypothetical protein